VNKNNTYIIGLSGGTCSGKTYLSKSIQKYFGIETVNIINLDSYYYDLSHLTFKDRERNNFDHPDSFDFNLLFDDLSKIINQNSANIPIYDYKTHTRTNRTMIIHKTKIILIEGILTFYNKKIRNLMHLKCFLDKPSELRKKIRLNRDIEQRARTNKSILQQYSTTVEPMYIKYIKETKKYADLVIKEDTIVNSNALGILCEEINKILN